MPWVIIGALALAVIVLSVKLYYMRKSADEISQGLKERAEIDTNTLIGISSNDRKMRGLATAVNTELKKLRAERRRFQRGDTEIKNAITNISHDLRTPLTAIFGYLDLLEREEASEAQKRYIGIIRNRSELLRQLTEELFRYSVMLTAENGLAREPVTINAVLEESAAAFYTALGERRIVPEIEMPEAAVVRELDRAALSRVFSNLLSNAIKYSGGDLRIVLTEAGEITFSNTAEDLSEIQVGRLFDRFYTVEAARKSTGLGLAIARTLVERMGGSITAAYENNRLSISILFPAENE
ncbi:MAG: HAMP domain-containing histidine kinase [Oscillospiraceae bacterium]|nr:HAMP domain-containing histidine kinase [Oscillospiraceae bacterium]